MARHDNWHRYLKGPTPGERFDRVIAWVRCFFGMHVVKFGSYGRCIHCAKFQR